MAKDDAKKDRLCSQCGRLESEHVAVNFADVDTISDPVLLCPRAIFVPVGNGK
jgi:hypothetical protein